MHAQIVKEENCKEVLDLVSKQVKLSKQALHILNTSQQFDDLGRTIFLDRYSLKSKRDDVQIGDLVIVVTGEDLKFPKKDLGVITEIHADGRAKLHMVSGMYASPEEKYTFTADLIKCDKPLESINDACYRVAQAAASVEPEAKREEYTKLFFDQLSQKRIQPSGRIMTGANVGSDKRYTQNLTLYNCYVLPSPKDTRASIVQDVFFAMIETMCRGGGVGINLSTLRPRYAYVRGVHGKSSGAVSWGGLYSFGTGLIEQGGSRRGALMLMMEDWHPDVLEFISSKTQMGRLENANISVLITDKFMDAVKKDAPWPLVFPDYESVTKEVYEAQWDGDLDKWIKNGHAVKTYKTIKARELWDKIIRSAHASAEPGVVFHERYNKMSNSWYFNRIISTNPCGEQGLPAWGVCNLGHLYLASFVKQVGKDNEGPLYEMDWDALGKSARVLSRFLDNIIDLNNYHFKTIEENQKGERRIGGGTLGLGELLIKLRIKYGSDASIPIIEKIYKTICVEMYKESSRAAKEKGAFPQFNAEKFLQSGFMKTMPEDVRTMVRENGIRNVTLTTQAPTGTVGSMLGTSTGIEPYYSFEFYRQSRLGFHKCLIGLADDYLKANGGKLPDYFVHAMNLSPLDHVRVQAAVQKWTDSSISKTANAPQDFTVEQTKELYEHAYDLGCKGVTIYRDNCRAEQVLTTDASMEKRNMDSSTGKGGKTKLLNEEEYGTEQGKKCPQCMTGTMVKLGGCTECNNQCGFKGSCDVK